MTNLIIQNCHCQQGHCGPSQVLAFIRQRFWIVCGLSVVGRVLAKCMNCCNQKARLGEQIMAPLPSARVAPTDPLFSHVGVDYFSPLFVKQGRSKVKMATSTYRHDSRKLFLLLIAMAHPSRVLNLDMKAKLCMRKSYICLQMHMSSKGLSWNGSSMWHYNRICSGEVNWTVTYHIIIIIIPFIIVLQFTIHHSHHYYHYHHLVVVRSYWFVTVGVLVGIYVSTCNIPVALFW